MATKPLYPLSARISRDTYEWLREQSFLHRRSVNAEVNEILEKARTKKAEESQFGDQTSSASEQSVTETNQ